MRASIIVRQFSHFILCSFQCLGFCVMSVCAHDEWNTTTTMNCLEFVNMRAVVCVFFFVFCHSQLELLDIYAVNKRKQLRCSLHIIIFDHFSFWTLCSWSLCIQQQILYNKEKKKTPNKSKHYTNYGIGLGLLVFCLILLLELLQFYCISINYISLPTFRLLLLFLIFHFSIIRWKLYFLGHSLPFPRHL